MKLKLLNVQEYQTPQVEVHEILCEGLLCQSGGFENYDLEDNDIF